MWWIKKVYRLAGSIVAEPRVDLPRRMRKREFDRKDEDGDEGKTLGIKLASSSSKRTFLTLVTNSRIKTSMTNLDETFALQRIGEST